MDKKKRRYKIISLFSGCGGMDLGFVDTGGFEIAWANDNDHWACETYRNYFGDHIVEADITKVDIKKIPNGCDVVLGGFPCQDFSVIWKRRGIKTERGNLYSYFVKIVEEKKPKIFIAENVKGLMAANRGGAIAQIIEHFSKIGGEGYSVEVKLVNFADYGTPQTRQRVLIIGVRRDLKKGFEMPEPTHSEKTHVSSKIALRGVENAKYNNEHQNIHPETVEKLKLIPAGGNFTAIPKDSPYYVKGMISHVYRRLHPDKPSTTIIAGGGGGTWGYHYKEPRPLTNRERARLFGYPDKFVFSGSITEVRRQIGNSVPPVGIKPFAENVYKLLES